MRGIFRSLAGQTFGRLEVLKLERIDHHRGSMWKCRCIPCGEIIIVPLPSLTSVEDPSCASCRVRKKSACLPGRQAAWDYEDPEGSGAGGDPLVRLRNRPGLAIARSLLAELEARHVTITPAGVCIDISAVADLAAEQLAALVQAGLLARPQEVAAA